MCQKMLESHTNITQCVENLQIIYEHTFICYIICELITLLFGKIIHQFALFSSEFTRLAKKLRDH